MSDPALFVARFVELTAERNAARADVERLTAEVARLNGELDRLRNPDDGAILWLLNDANGAWNRAESDCPGSLRDAIQAGQDAAIKVFRTWLANLATGDPVG